MLKREKVTLTLVGLIGVGASFYGMSEINADFYLLPGLLLLSFVGFKVDPLLKNLCVTTIQSNFETLNWDIPKSEVQEFWVPFTLVLGWPLWFVAVIVKAWRM